MNPWLNVPLEDYEGHMALPYVGQAKLLSELFGSAIEQYAPCSVAILGCAGGNGLERIATTAIARVVCIDINPDYVERTRVRFGTRFARLELHVGDLQTGVFAVDPVELVYAGLLFEYVDVAKVLATTRPMLCPAGVLVTVLQLLGSVPDVTPSPYTSLSALSSALHLVSPQRLRQLAEKVSFGFIEEKIVQAEGGKRFQVQSFRAETPNRAR